jgi:hypothetical protein
MEAAAEHGEVITSVETNMNTQQEEVEAPKAALTPPTSEDMDKRPRMSSELSELDSDDDGEEIEPDHYFEGGKIPVFKPVCVSCAASCIPPSHAGKTISKTLRSTCGYVLKQYMC